MAVLLANYRGTAYFFQLTKVQEFSELEKILKNIDDTELQLKKVIKTILEIDKQPSDKDMGEDFSRIESELLHVRRELAALREKARELELDIVDSSLFIKTLEDRVISLDESIATREILGDLPIQICPLCLSPLKKEVGELVCPLCKAEDIAKDSGKTQALRMKQELLNQIKESRSLLAEKKNTLSIITRRIPELIEQRNIKQSYFDEFINKVKSQRHTHIDSLNVKRGNLESKLQFLHQQAKAASVFDRIKRRKEILALEVEGLNNSIQIKKATQEARLAEAKKEIQDIAIFLLKNDLPREETFRYPFQVDIDFIKNTFSVNGRNQFSASSITYLKNCIHYAIFFSSLKLEYFRYPRFIICDNMEDKGMEEIRSQNFQRLIVDTAKEMGSNIEHQIIFTTSMIDPSLDNSEMCIGPKYSEKRKALQFKD